MDIYLFDGEYTWFLHFPNKFGVSEEKNLRPLMHSKLIFYKLIHRD